MDNKKNKTLAIVLGIFALVIVTTAASFAFFTYSRTGTTTSTIISGDIEFSFIEGDSATLANAFPVADNVGAVDTTGEYEFDVRLSSSSNSNKMNYNVLLVDNNDEADTYYFNNEQIKFSLVKNNTYVANTSTTSGVKLSTIDGFDDTSNQGEGIVLQDQEITAGTTDNYKLRIWISDEVNYSNTVDGQDNQESIGKYNSYKYSLKVKVTSGVVETPTTTPEYKDESGANAPAIKTGMIPVTYNGTNWVKADTNGEWYNYNEQWWANAVTVSEENRDTYMRATAGTPISMDDINTMWVWVPRYEYETITSTTATEIKVNFLTGTESNKTSNYITHPAFTFGTDELTGIWVAKFEASSDSSCTAKNGDIDTGCDLTSLKVKVKPNVTSWRGIRISTIDLNTRAMNDGENIYGFLETELDTHAMKNMEWGAVAYLSQSKYGKYGNSSFAGDNKEIYQNKSSEYITGMSNGTPSSSTINTQIAYNIEGTGTGASTTGNIYGIYDMSGGAWEYTMAVIKDNSSNNPMSGNTTIQNSGFTGTLYDSGNYTSYSGRTWPESKYYDLYEFGTTYNDDAAYARYKIGDATTETKGWNGDGLSFAYANFPWFVRGGFYNGVTAAGLFNVARAYGYSNADYAFRPIVVQK